MSENAQWETTADKVEVLTLLTADFRVWKTHDGAAWSVSTGMFTRGGAAKDMPAAKLAALTYALERAGRELARLEEDRAALRRLLAA